MGKDFAQVSPVAAEVFALANAALGYDLSRICFEGPADQQEQTDIQQPAIFTTSMAIWKSLDEGRALKLNGTIVAMAGLSLGEYTALCAAGSISFTDGLHLVRKRGELMQSAARSTPSGMVSALGLEMAKIEAICREVTDQTGGILVPANFNCPGQVVLSGTKAACEASISRIEQAGGRAMPLKVAGAFHSPIMQPAADGLEKILSRTPFETPKVPVVANVNCENHRDAVTIRGWLADQLTQPVRWQASIERLLREGVERFVEIGPGRILTGLLKKIARRTPVINVSTAEDLKQFPRD